MPRHPFVSFNNFIPLKTISSPDDRNIASNNKGKKKSKLHVHRDTPQRAHLVRHQGNKSAVNKETKLIYSLNNRKETKHIYSLNKIKM